MIWVIASSSTVEYGMKALYETLIGRLTDTKEVVTAEDQFNAQFARSYVDFIKDRPWYEFDFKSQLGKLWATSFWGDHFFRKIERKYMLTCELMVKWAYGKLIGMGTQTVYGAALPTTIVVVDKIPTDFATENIIQTFPDQSAIIKLPRYDKFNSASIELAKVGVVFKEIAGNTSAILLTVLTDAEREINYDNAQTIFIQPISSNRTLKRIAFAIPVAQLSGLLKNLNEDGIEVEHVFDF